MATKQRTHSRERETKVMPAVVSRQRNISEATPCPP